MANYTPQNAIDMVRKYCGDVPVTSIDCQSVDLVHSMIWRAYPWRWTIGALTAIALVDGTQDYTVSNADVYRFLRLRIVRTDTTPDEFGPLLDIRDSLEPDLGKYGYPAIEAIAFEPVSGKLRLESAAAVGATETLQIQGEYQKVPTTILDAALGTSFVMPDIYFGAMFHGLKWMIYDFNGDKRAGTVTVTKDGRTAYSGQLGIFMGQLQNLAESEDYGAEQILVPETVLGARW